MTTNRHPISAQHASALTRRQWSRWATGALALAAPSAWARAGQGVDDGEWQASATARQLLRWVAGTADNAGMPFVVIDKPEACVHVFSGRAQWLGSAPVLLGLAAGDRSVPGIGQRPVAQVRPHERTTPAGRFVTEPGQNLQGEDIVWIDYDAAVSLHRVRSATAIERRLQRLASPRAQRHGHRAAPAAPGQPACTRPAHQLWLHQRTRCVLQPAHRALPGAAARRGLCAA